MNNRILHIVFATADSITSNKMLISIGKKLPNYTLTVGVLLIGQRSPVDIDSFCVPVKIIGEYSDYLPISKSRNLCQSYLQKAMRSEKAIGLILDDDLQWIMTEPEFDLLCGQLQFNHCDMAFSTLSGDAPVPKEYTRASPLLDLLLAISDSSKTEPLIGGFVSGVNVTNEINAVTNCHHDYYSYDKQAFNRVPIAIENLDWIGFIKNLYLGKTTTRPVVTPTSLCKAVGRERGGATLIFNPAVLGFTNQSIFFQGVVSRRSDMIMATSAHYAGYKLFNTPAVLSHNRSDTFDSHDHGKLLGDILGYALIESYTSVCFSKELFLENLYKRLSNTLNILRETSEMLLELQSWLKKSALLTGDASNLIGLMVRENSKSINKMESIDLNDVLFSLDELNKKCA